MRRTTTDPDAEGRTAGGASGGTALHDVFDASVEEGPHNGAATAALTLGLLSLLLSVLTGVPAVVAGLVGLVRARSRGTGAVRSAVGLVLGLLSVVLVLAALAYLRPVWTTVQDVRAQQQEGLPAADSPQAQQGVAQAKEALEQIGVDTSSLDCGQPEVGLTEVRVSCTGQTLSGEPAAVEGTCPAAQLLGGSATCEATVNGTPTSLRVTLVDGMPRVEVL